MKSKCWTVLATLAVFAVCIVTIPGDDVDATDGDAFSIGDQTYSSLSEAIVAADADDTIQMMMNTSTQPVTIDKGVKLDLGGKTLTIIADGTTSTALNFTSGYSEITNGAIVDNRSLGNSSNGFMIANVAGSESSLSFSDVSMYQYAPESSYNYGVYVRGGATLRIGSNVQIEEFSQSSTDAGMVVGIGVIGPVNNDSGSSSNAITKLIIDYVDITVGGFAIAGSGSYDGTSITINDCYLHSSRACAIYHPQRGDLTVNNGTITGTSGIQYCGNGTITINGGTITGTFEKTEFPQKPPSQNDGSTDDGAALSIISRGDGYQQENDKIVVNINGGIFISENNSAINSYRFYKVGNDWQTGDGTNIESFVGNVNITGGEFKSPADKSPIEYDSKDEDAYAVSGGSFSSAISQNLITSDSKLEQTADGSYVAVSPSTADITGSNPSATFHDDNGDGSISILSDGNYSNITVNLDFDGLTIVLTGNFDLGYTTISLVGSSAYSDMTEIIRFSIVITNPSGETRFSYISIHFPITPADYEGLNLGIYPISGGSLIEDGTTSFDTNGLTYSGPYYSDFAVAVVDGSSGVNPPSWDEEELPPFIPTQDSDDDSVTIVACAAAAAVAAIMAVFLIIDRKR